MAHTRLVLHLMITYSGDIDGLFAKMVRYWKIGFIKIFIKKTKMLFINDFENLGRKGSY